jgi:hypothetical protein
MRPSIIDTPDIGARAKEIRDAEMRVLAGCTCPAAGDGNVNHRDGCALWPGLPPATPPCPAMVAAEMQRVANEWFFKRHAILADHRRAVAEWAERETGR